MAFVYADDTGYHGLDNNSVLKGNMAMQKTDFPSLPMNMEVEVLGILLPFISLGAKLV